MSAVAQAGRTVLFVSHSMPSVSLLCGRAILLEGGQIALDGSTNQTIEKYLLADAQITGTWRSSTPDQAAAPIQLLQARILKPSGEPAAIDQIQLAWMAGYHDAVTRLLLGDAYVANGQVAQGVEAVKDLPDAIGRLEFQAFYRYTTAQDYRRAADAWAAVVALDPGDQSAIKARDEAALRAGQK